MAAGEEVRAMLEALEANDAVTLSPVERLLLATDGTVTHMLEALTRGSVEVDILDRRAYDSNLTRDVVLRSEHGDDPLVWARSKVNLPALPVGVADELIEGDIGIGDLLRRECEETRREIVGMRPVYPPGEPRPDFIDGPSTLCLERTYHIYSRGVRIMTITEWFQKGTF